MFTYIYMYIYVYAFIYTHLHIYKDKDIDIPPCVSMCMYLYLHTFTIILIFSRHKKVKFAYVGCFTKYLLKKRGVGGGARELTLDMDRRSVEGIDCINDVCRKAQKQIQYLKINENAPN